MKRPTNRAIALISAGALAVGAGGATIGWAASGGGDTNPAAGLAAALNRNEGTNLTEADVRQAMQDAFKARLDADVAAGRLTQAQADEMLKRVKEAPQRRAQHEARHAARIAPVAAVLGMSADEIRDALRNGSSLADLATKKGVSRAKLLAAIKKGIQAEAKAAGVTLSAARLNQMAKRAADNERGFGRGGLGGHRGGHGPGPGFGPFGG